MSHLSKWIFGLGCGYLFWGLEKVIALACPLYLGKEVFFLPLF